MVDGGQEGERRAAGVLTRGVAAGTFGFLSAGLVECLFLPRPQLFAEGVPAMLVAVAHLLGIVGTLGVLTGLGLACLLPPLEATLLPLLSPARARALGSEPLLRASAEALAFAFGAALPVLAMLLWGGGTRAFNREALVGPYLALLVGLSLAVAFVLFVPVRELAHRVLARLAPQGRVGALPLPVLLALLAFVAVAAALLVLTRNADLTGYRFGPAALTSLALTVSVVLWFVGAKLRAPRVLGGALLTVSALCLWALFGLGSSPVSARVLPLHGLVSQLGLRVLRTALDLDRDGHAALLGGGDCDDLDPDVGPHARDLPGNGLDENCEGGDAGLSDPADAGRVTRAPLVKPRPLSVVLIMIDTLRPDHMSLYGYARPTTPNLDRWAKSAVVFEHAYAQAPHTPRSLPSLLTGRYPSRLSWVAPFANVSDLAPDNELLFDIFARASFRMEAVTAHWYFEQVPTLRRSVARWHNVPEKSLEATDFVNADPKVTEQNLLRLDALARDPSRPFLLFTHYFSPHARYLRHDELPSFGTSAADVYDGEIQFMDHHLAPLLERLDRPDLRENAVVVIFGDHGEALGEHGLKLHGHTVFEPEMRVPLLVRVPGQKAKRVREVAALIDILPTLVELTSLAAPKAQGRSLLPLWLEPRGEWPERLVFLEQIPYPEHPFRMVGAVDGRRRKLVHDVSRNVTMLFDLARDPGEQRALRLDMEGEDAPLAHGLAAFLDADPALKVPGKHRDAKVDGR